MSDQANSYESSASENIAVQDASHQASPPDQGSVEQRTESASPARQSDAETGESILLAQLSDTPLQSEASEAAGTTAAKNASESAAQVARVPLPSSVSATRGLGDVILDALQTGAVPVVTAPEKTFQTQRSSIAPTDTNSEAATANPANGRPATFATSLFQALQQGSITTVSDVSSIVSGQGVNEGVNGFPAHSTTSTPETGGLGLSPEAQALMNNAQMVRQSLGTISPRDIISSSGLNGTSGIRVGQVQGLVNLGTPVAVGNTELMTPFAAQEVTPDGRLSTPVVQLGQTTELMQTLGSSSALMIGGKTPVSTVVPVPMNTPVSVRPGTVPNPAGTVSVSCLTPRLIEGTGDGEINELVFRVTRTNSMAVESIDWVLTGLDPIDLVDGAAAFSGKVQFSSGQQFADVRLPVRRDALSELDKPITFTIADGLYSRTTMASTQSELIDDDRSLITVESVRVSEGSPWAVFTVTLSNPVSSTLTFTPAVRSDTARINEDFGNNLEYSLDGGQTWLSAVNGVTVPAEATSLLVRAPINLDRVYEGPETFVLDTGPISASEHDVTRLLQNPQGSDAMATVVDDGSPLADGTMVDDDRPDLLVEGVSSLSEGSPAVFAVTLTRPLAHPTAVRLQTDLVSAEAPDLASELTVFYFDDPVLRTRLHTLPVVNGEVTLPAGVTVFSVRADTAHDPVLEGLETFGLTASFVDPTLRYTDRTGANPTERTGAVARDTTTIVDDGSGMSFDAWGLRLVDDPSTVEDESAAIDDRPLAVSSPVVNEASPYAVFTVTGAPGQLLKLALGTTPDSADTDGTLGTDTTNAGTSVPLQYFDGTDWVDYTPGSLVAISPSGSTLLVRTALRNDNAYEGPETFTLAATNTGGTAGTGVATINDRGDGIIFLDQAPNPDGTPAVDTFTVKDDDRPDLHLAGVPDVSEGSPAVFTVTLSRAVAHDTEIDLRIQHNSTQAADLGATLEAFYYNDAIARTGLTMLTVDNGRITLPAGVTTFAVRVSSVADSQLERSEAFELEAVFVDAPLKFADLTGNSPTLRTGASSTGEAVIFDDGRGTVYGPEGQPVINDPDTPEDESAPTDDRIGLSLMASPVIVTEGDVMPFLVRRNSVSGPLTVDYEALITSSDSSTLPITLLGTVTFADGQDEALLNLASLQDQRRTDDQNFNLVLSSSNPDVRIDRGLTTGTVQNDDADISIASLVVSGPDANGLYTYTVTVTRSGAQGLTHAVDWSVAGVGENPADTGGFVLPASRTVTFAANAGDQTFSFQAPAGLELDGERTFQVSLAEAVSTADRVTLGRDAVRGSITPAGASASIAAVTTGLAEDAGAQTFRINLSRAVSNDVVIDWNVASFGSGTQIDANAADFGGSLPTGRVTIAAGQTSATFQVTPTADSTVEVLERYLVDFTVVSGLAGKVGPAALGRILNDDSVAQFAFDTFSVLEGAASAGGTLQATVARSGALQRAFDVTWHVEAQPGVDPASIAGWFAGGQTLGTNGLPRGTLSLISGQVESVVSVRLTGNPNIEADRLFRIVLDSAGPGGAIGPRNSTTATIDDDDARFEMASATLVHEEGQGGGSSIIQLTVNRTGDARQAAVVNWTALGSGANPTNALDLMSGNSAGTLVFAAGATSATLNIAVNPDNTVEANETLTVTLTGTPTPHHALGSNTSTVVTLNNDDFTVAFDGAAGNLTQSKDEDGGSPFGGAVFTFNVVRSGDLRQAVDVAWNIPLSGNLTADDFMATSGVVSFAAGSATATLTVTARTDRVVEADEAFSVVLQPSAGVTLGQHSTASGTLVNDDVAIVATLSPAASEGAGGTTSTYTYTLTRVGDTARQASDVNWSVAGVQVSASGSEVAAALSAGEISSTATGNLTWAAGDASGKIVTVTVANDQTVEADEAFALTLESNGSDRSELRASGLAGVVHDDDVQVAIDRLSDATIVEGAQGTSVQVSFRVSRSGDLSSTLVVALQTAGVPGATGPSSVTFNPITPGTATITLANGSTQTVQLRGGEDFIDVTYTLPGNDVLDSDGATFTVTLANPVATAASGRVVDTASIDGSRASASLTVTDDDDRITVTPSATSVAEGNSGSTAITFTLTRDGDTSRETVITWRILPGTGVGVSADDFAPNQQDIQVPNNGLPSGRVTFAANETSKTITVNISGDTTIEADETLVLALSTSGNTQLADTPVTVLGDDAGYNILARTANLDEGNDPNQPRWLTFDVVRAGVSGSTTVNWTLAGLTASDIEAVEVGGIETAVGSLTFSGTNSDSTTGTLTFADGQTGAVIRVRLVQDAIAESNETATLSVASTAAPNTPLASASTTVINDDTALSITAGVASVVEGSDNNLARVRDGTPDTVDVTFTVNRSGNLALTTTVNWAVLAQNGITAADFDGDVLPTGSLTFGATETSKTITVKVRKDWAGEANEGLTVQLSNATPGTQLVTPSATTTITDDDTLLAFSSYTSNTSPLVHDEGDSGWVDYSFTITRTGNTSLAQVVGWRVLEDEEGLIEFDDFYDTFLDPNATGPGPAPRVLPYGTVSFAANETSKTITLKINSQTFAPEPLSRSSQQEIDELFSIELYNPIASLTNSSFSVSDTAGTAWGQITNDDVRIQTTVINSGLPEGRDPALNGGDVNANQAGTQRWITHSLTVKRMGDPREAVSFEWYVDALGFADNMLTADANGNILTVTYDNLQGTPLPANLASGVYTAGAPDTETGKSRGELKGVLSWAANDVTERTLYFTALPDDLLEGDYRFKVKVRPNPADPTGSARIDEFSLGVELEDTQTSSAFTSDSGISLGTIIVQRDETELWITNEVQRRYDPALNTYRDEEDYADTHLPAAIEVTDYDEQGRLTFEDFVLSEGTVIAATAGADYVASNGTLTFNEANRVRTLTTALQADSSVESFETFSVFLSGASKANVVTDQARQTIIDGDGTLASGRRLDIIGSTAIEGVDSHLQFRVSFGQPLTTQNTFRLNLGDPADPEALVPGTNYQAQDFWSYVARAYNNPADGHAGDYLRNIEYSTDKGVTWQSTAPMLSYSFEAGVTPTQATSAQVLLSFDNSRVGIEGEDDFEPAARFDAWMDFSDLRAGQNLQVGGRLSGIEFPGIGAPLRDPTVDYYLVVEQDGVYIDTDNDGIKDANENTPAFMNWLDSNANNTFDAGEVLRTTNPGQKVDYDNDGFGDANEINWTDQHPNGWWWIPLDGNYDANTEKMRPLDPALNLTGKKVVLQFNAVPYIYLNFNWLDANDQVQFDLQAMVDSGVQMGSLGKTVTSTYSAVDRLWYGDFDFKNALNVSAQNPNNAQTYQASFEAYKLSNLNHGGIYVNELNLTIDDGNSSTPVVKTQLATFGFTAWVSGATVNGQSTGFHTQMTTDPPRGAPRGDIWIPVRADATIGTPEIAFGNTEGIGKIEGTYLGVANLDGTSSANNTAALEYFRSILNRPTLDEAGIQAYFDVFDPSSLVPGVKLLRFQVDWDQTGDPTWQINGLDPSVIVAPQTEEWAHLGLIKNVALQAGQRSATFDVALGDPALQWLREDGSDLYGARLEASAAGGVVSGPVGVRAPGSDSLEDHETVADWDGTLTIGAGADDILIRTRLLDDAIDEPTEELALSVTQVSGDVFNGNFATGTVSLVDDDAPKITLGTSVVRDPVVAQDFLVKVIDINNRAGDTPNAAVRFGGTYVYQSDSMINNTAAGQDFTVTVRYKGDWEVAAFSEIVAISTDFNYEDEAGTGVHAGLQHSAPPSFVPLAGTPEIINGQATGFMLAEVNVQAGTYQLMLRSPVETIAYEPEHLFIPDGDLFDAYAVSDLTAPEQALSADFSVSVTHVAPTLVARRGSANETDGTLTTEVIAVGGDFNTGDASVNYQTVDGGWQDKTFVISRERSTLDDLTVIWELRPPEDLPEGTGGARYVTHYFGHERIQPAPASDFVVLDGQWVQPIQVGVDSNGDPEYMDVIRGYATLIPGQKEAVITVRVRSDDAIEAVKDFSVAIIGERIGSADSYLFEDLDGPGDVTYKRFENFVVVGNPEGYLSDGEGGVGGDLAAAVHGAVGYGRIDTDDRAFIIKGRVFNEGQDTPFLPPARDPNFTAELAALRSANSDLLVGYTLHQFAIDITGSGPGRASVDWQLVVSGIDGTGGFNVGSQTLVNGVPTQAPGAHQAEMADFMVYDASQGSFDTAFGMNWTTAGISASEAKTVFFESGQTRRVITLAIRDDLLAEDAEQFTIRLTNPQALEGSSGPVSVDPLQGEAEFLIGDDDAVLVTAAVYQRNGTDNTTDRALVQNGLFVEGSGGWYLGTTGTGYRLSLQDAPAAPTDNNTADDQRLVLKFTRSGTADTLNFASQAYFELQVTGTTTTPAPEMHVEGGANVREIRLLSGNVLYRGIVDFMAGATEAEVRFRVEDDFRLDSEVPAVLMLLDAEHLPLIQKGETYPLFAQGGWDVTGIGDALNLPDWNITRANYPVEVDDAIHFRMGDDDAHLWLNAFKQGDATTYAFDHDGDPSNTPYDLSLRDPRLRAVEGDPTSGPPAVRASTSDGDFSFTLAARGMVGNFSVPWEIVLSGTATQADFNAAKFNLASTYTNAAGKTVLVGAASVAFAGAGVGTIQDLFVTDFTPEADKTFDFVLKNPVTASGKPYFYSPDGASPHPQMTIKVTLADDDVIYRVEWNSTDSPVDANQNATVREGDVGSTDTREFVFDVSRELGAGGFAGGSTVMWRVVPVNSATITASDFAGTFVDGDGNPVLPFGTVVFSGQVLAATAPYAQTVAPELLKTIRLSVRGDAQVEYGEQFRIELYNPSVGHVEDANGSVTGVIVNDDTGLQVLDTSLVETDSGDVVVLATIRRSGDLVRLLKDDATTTTYDERVTTVNWIANDQTTNASDRGSGSFSGTEVFSPNSGATHTYGYAEENRTVTFNLKGDATVEADETLQVLLSGAQGIDEVIDANATVTLRNDDTVFSVIPTPGSDAANNAIIENAGGTWSFRITRSVATPQDQTVTWAVVSGGGRNTVNAADFGGTLPTGTVTFTGNELYKDITFMGPGGDVVPEGDEVFLLEVTAFGAGAENDTFVATDSGAKGTIVNDDAALFLSDTYAIGQIEGSGSDVRQYRFEVVRAGTGLTNTTTVDWALDFTGTGAQASDFAANAVTSGTLTFNADGRQTVSIAIDPDIVAESATQDFKIRLSNAQGGLTILGADGNGVLEVTGELLDDDFTLAVADATMTEGDGLRQMAFVVTRTGPAALPAAVNWSLDFTGKTAAANDFSATSGSFVVPAGVSSYTFYVPVIGEAQWEEDETFTLNISYNGGTGTDSASGRLTNDDAGFSLAAITPVSESAGSLTFTVKREGDTTGTDSVGWVVSAGATNSASLVAGQDFGNSQTLAGTVSFGANETEKTVTLTLVNDNVTETDENFTVTLINPSVGASLKSAEAAVATGTIRNDDQGYGVRANVPSIVENAAANGDTVTFTIDRYVPTGTSSVKWKLEIASGDTTALALQDLLIDGAAATQDAFSGTTLNYANGEASKTVTVKLVGDNRLENLANLRMVLERATGDTTSTLVTSSAQVDVQDDDKELALVPLGSTAVAEGQAGTTVLDYKVTRVGAASGVASATWTLAGSGANPVSADDIDRIEVNGVLATGLSGTVSFADGDVADKAIRVFVKGDTVGEFDETFTLTLSSPSASTVLTTASAVQTVLNDDPAIRLEMATTSVAEGNDGDDRFLSFRVIRSGDLSQTASVRWDVLTAASGNSVNAADFGGTLPAGLLTFVAGEAEKTVTFQTFGDDTIESDEGLRVQLSDPVGATLIGAAEIAATLRNDDARVSIAAPASVLEGRNGTQTLATFTLSASGPTTMSSVVVIWHVEGVGLNPARGADFVGGVLPSGQTTVNLSSGSGTANLVITLAGDNIYGPNEQFKVVLDSATALIGSDVGGVSFATREATLAVRDDDTLIGLSQTETHRYVEGDTGTTVLRFYVDELNRPADGPTLADIRVDYTLSGDINASDVAALTDTNVALQRDTSGGANNGRYYIGVTLNSDTTVEANERFTLRLDNAYITAGGSVEIARSGNLVSGEVVNDDFALRMSSPSLVQYEDTGRFVFDLVRTGPTDHSMEVSWRVGSPSSLSSGEYSLSSNDLIDPLTGQAYAQSTTTPITGQVTFAAGASTARFVLNAARDNLPETNERFVVEAKVTQVDGNAWTARPADQVAILEGQILNDDLLPTPFDPTLDHAQHPMLATL